MPRVAIASSSRLSAAAGADIARAGGNAVDAAIGASLVSMVTEPGIVGLGGGAFVTVWPPGRKPVTVDGYGEMPGRGLPEERFGAGREVWLEYGGGLTTVVGYGSEATPGTLAGLDLAWRQHGRIPWRELFVPAIEHAERGFPLPQASYNYLIHSHELIYGWHLASRSAIHRGDGSLKEAGELVRIEGLAESLRQIAEEGVGAFYLGELGKRISEETEAGGGILTRTDLETYEAELRQPLDIEMAGWHLTTNPPPAIGGAILATMLRLMGDAPRGDWTPAELRRLIEIQQAVFEHRFANIDPSPDPEADVRVLLGDATLSRLRRGLRSPSTVHTSAVDELGLGCAISSSTGYGSGSLPGGTGIWMNNFLGELELNRRGYHAWEPGTRLPSNMAPSVARRSDGAVLAIGSPGADRITTALAQVLVNYLNRGLPLTEAVAYSRLHVEYPEGSARVAYEPGLKVDALAVAARRFDELSMFFGGVGAALWEPDSGFTVASDPRRQGGAEVSS